VRVSAGSLAITNGGQISTVTRGPFAGAAGDVAVTVIGDVVITGPGIPSATPSAIIASVIGSDSRGQAGKVVLMAGGAIALSGGGQITSSTFGVGNGGSVQVTAGGPLSLADPGTGIIGSATSTASGDAGSVMVRAPQIALMRGAEISSTTAGTGKGGSVIVTTPGALVLDGAGVGNTQIAASATGLQSGPGGSVTVRADTLTVEGGARIASTTAGPGTGGDIAVAVANGVTLSGNGPNGASGISAAALPGSSGAAGEVVLKAGGAIALAAFRTVPAAVRFSTRTDPIEVQSRMARSIGRDHVACLAAIAAVLVIQLAAGS